MAAVGLLRLAVEHGVEITRVGDRLRVRPATALTPDLRERLQAEKAELLRIVPEAPTPEAVVWRLDAMLAQVPPVGPIRGLLTARDGAWPADGAHCVSCGDRLAIGAVGHHLCGVPMRCEPCRLAAASAIEMRRRRP